MEDEDDDYMADLSRFLPTESAGRASQARNGKPLTDGKDKIPRKEKRKAKQEHQKKAEEEQRKEGLGSAIPSTNIGFKMLQMMGYSPGAALGKHGQGLLEPVSIDLKRSRTGLGRDSAAKEEEAVKARRAEVENLRNRQKEKELRADFHERRRGSWQSRKIISNYRKACAACTQLEESSSSFTLAKHLDKYTSSDPQESATVEEDLSNVGDVEHTAAEPEEEEEITLEPDASGDVAKVAKPIQLLLVLWL